MGSHLGPSLFSTSGTCAHLVPRIRVARLRCLAGTCSVATRRTRLIARRKLERPSIRLAIGLGSAAFHATLHHKGQPLDEASHRDRKRRRICLARSLGNNACVRRRSEGTFVPFLPDGPTREQRVAPPQPSCNTRATMQRRDGAAAARHGGAQGRRVVARRRLRFVWLAHSLARSAGACVLVCAQRARAAFGCTRLPVDASDRPASPARRERPAVATQRGTLQRSRSAGPTLGRCHMRHRPMHGHTSARALPGGGRVPVRSQPAAS